MLSEVRGSLHTVTLRINDRDYTVEIEPRVTLLDLSRERLELTGSKKGCDHGQCGDCTVLIDGHWMNSCLADIQELMSGNLCRCGAYPSIVTA